MLPSKRLQIFISSTFKDLIEERQAAVQAILASGHIPAGMELFAAGDQSQMNVIKDWINQSDIYLLILGGCYGSIEPNSGFSYTQIEYEYALSIGKPAFAVVIKPEHLEEKVRKSGPSFIETENSIKYKSFKELVLSKVVRFWADVKDIKLAIFETVLDFSKRSDLIGWVPGNQKVDTSKMAEELARLASENSKLWQEKKEIKEQSDSIVKLNLQQEKLNFIRRTEKHHSIAHNVRNLAVKLMPEKQPEIPNNFDTDKAIPLSGNLHYKFKDDLRDILERTVDMVQLLVPKGIKIWCCIRERRNDDHYHTLIRAGDYNPSREQFSQPLHKDCATIKSLKESYKSKKDCVFITGSSFSAKKTGWQKIENDIYKEDLSVIMGAILSKSWTEQNWVKHKLNWILFINADAENVFDESFIPLTKCCNDMLALLLNAFTRGGFEIKS